ncbi:MAG: hypothetical protein ACK5PQ_04590 [Alphaproteobacteria bacterium]
MMMLKVLKLCLLLSVSGVSLWSAAEDEEGPAGGAVEQIKKAHSVNVVRPQDKYFLEVHQIKPAELDSMKKIIEEIPADVVEFFSDPRPLVSALSSLEDKEFFFCRYKKYLEETKGHYDPRGMLKFMVSIDGTGAFEELSWWADGEKDFLRNYYPPLRVTPLPEKDILRNSLQGFPEEEIWRLFVDGCHQKDKGQSGWGMYEVREEGCILGMMNSLSFALKTQDPLSFELYTELHTLCLDLIRFFHPIEKTGLACEATSVTLIPNRNLSLKGFFELRQEKYQQWFQLSVVKRDYYEEAYKMTFSRGPIIAEKTVETIIESYRSRMEQELKEEDKIKAIIQLASDLDRFHYFRDGNLRTAMIIAQRELIRNGFSPVVLEDPNSLDGFSQEELFEEFIKGMERFDFIKKNKAYPNADKDLTTEKLRLKFNKVGDHRLAFFKDIPDFWQKIKDHI